MPPCLKRFFDKLEGSGEMQKYICTNCGYVYDPAFGDPVGGIPPRTPFSDLPDTWICPVCYVAKDQFDPL